MRDRVRGGVLGLAVLAGIGAAARAATEPTPAGPAMPAVLRFREAAWTIRSRR
jgi:hypothetical protein